MRSTAGYALIGFSAHRCRASHWPGTLRSSSSSHTRALPSEGARQSPRGERLPPDITLGPLGSAERLYWLISKKRNRNTPSHFLISASVYERRNSSGNAGGHAPRAASCHACHARNATFEGRSP